MAEVQASSKAPWQEHNRHIIGISHIGCSRDAGGRIGENEDEEKMC